MTHALMRYMLIVRMSKGGHREKGQLGVIANTDNPLYTQTVSSTGIDPNKVRQLRETAKQKKRRQKKAKRKAKRFLLGLEVINP